MKVLVTDGNSRAALAITRSLGKKGHEVHVAATTPRSLAGSSKYCRHFHTYPDPADNRTEFLNSIEATITSHQIDILLPVTDICLLPVVEELDQLQAGAAVPFASKAMIERAADKVAITQLANEIGVATPRSRMLLDVPTDGGIDWDGRYPVVIKPARSRVKTDSGWLYTSVDYAHSPRELEDKLRAMPATIYPVLLQERIKGPGIGLFYCFDRGRRLATFAHQRLHEKPPSGGVSVLRESVAANPIAEEFGERLLGALEWHGVAMVEFKLDERDGVPKLMEINGRFWGSLQLAIDAGIDFPDLLVRIAAGEEIQPVEDYEIGIRSRWICGELDLLLLFLLKSRDELNLPEGHSSRFVSAMAAINPFVRNQKLEVLRMSDIKPWFYEVSKWLKG